MAFVDVGITGMGELDDLSPAATEAFVLKIVATNGNWKVPIGYFLVNGLSGPEKADLVCIALRKFYDTGIQVVSRTFRGPSSHLAMFKELGINPAFPHPSQWRWLSSCHYS